MNKEQELNLEFGLDDSAPLELEIDLAADDTSELVLSDLLGLTDIDLELSDDDDYTELELAEDEGEVEKPAEPEIIRENPDTSKDFEAYLSSVEYIINAVRARMPSVESLKVPLSASEFPYVPEGVLHIIRSTLEDAAINPVCLQRTEEECAIKCLDDIQRISGWTAGLNRQEFIAKYIEKCKLFRKLAAGHRDANNIDLLRAISREELEVLFEIYSVNSLVFKRVNQLLQQESTMIADKLPVRFLGDITVDYISRNKSRNEEVTIGDGVRLIYDFLFSPDVLRMLQLSTDDVAKLGVGEFMRRLAVYEIDRGIYKPQLSHKQLDSNILNDTESARYICLQELERGLQLGSVFAELMRIVCIVEDHFPTSARNPSTFYRDLAYYLCVASENPSRINPIPYGFVSRVNDGYILNYTLGEQTYQLFSPSVLCEAIGNNSSVYWIPRVIEDKVHGCVIYPPASLFINFRSATQTARVRVSGDMFYRFLPTITWLIENKILAEDKVEEEHVDGSSPMTTSSTLLQALMSYDNKFTETGVEVLPLVVSHGSKSFYAVKNPNTEDSYELALVVDNGQIISTQGTFVVDKSTGNVIANFFDLEDNEHSLVIPLAEVQEEYLGTETDQDKDDFDMRQFIHVARQTYAVDYQPYRKAVKALCELAALDYEEELRQVQRIMVRDLFYVLRISDIDALVASRICQAYHSYIQARKEEKIQIVLDAYNTASLQELADIILGVPNEFHEFNSWNAEFQRIYDANHEKLCYTVDDVCTYLDSLNFDVLALRALKYDAPEDPKQMQLFEAIHFIPEIGSRLSVLEDKMVALRVLYTLGDQLPQLFARYKPMQKFLNTPLLKNLASFTEELLASEMKEKKKKILSMSTAILDATERSESTLLMNLTLARKMHSFLCELESAGDTYADQYRIYMKELGFPYDVTASSMTEEEFRRKVSDAQVASIYDKYSKWFQTLIEEGLVNEALNKNILPLAKAYDLFNAFYDKLVNVPEPAEQVNEERYKDTFIKYAGSMIITYCPTQDPTTSNVIAGMTRAAAFVEASGDFIYDSDIEWLRPYPLVDFKNISMEYEAPIEVKTKSGTNKSDSVVDDDEEYELSYE